MAFREWGWFELKILIVEDSNRLRNTLNVGLTRSGFSVDAVEDGELALQYADAFEYAVIVLDLMIPKVDGIKVLRTLRNKGCEACILILSAKHQVNDRIECLQRGADDYLVKPFDFDELVARVNALMRRHADVRNPQTEIGEFTINTAMHVVTHNNQEIPLTPTELKIVEFLCSRRGRTVTPANLELQIYDSGTVVSKNAMEVHISSIRKKLAVHSDQKIIKTRRGFGYYIDADSP